MPRVFRSNSVGRAAAVDFCSALRTSTATTPVFGDYGLDPRSPGFSTYKGFSREVPNAPDGKKPWTAPDGEKPWRINYHGVIYAIAALACCLCVLFPRYRVFCLGLVNGALLSACCARPPPRGSYHRSVTP